MLLKSHFIVIWILYLAMLSQLGQRCGSASSIMYVHSHSRRNFPLVGKNPIHLLPPSSQGQYSRPTQILPHLASVSRCPYSKISFVVGVVIISYDKANFTVQPKQQVTFHSFLLTIINFSPYPSIIPSVALYIPSMPGIRQSYKIHWRVYV